MTVNLSTLFSVVIAVLGVYATYEKIHREHKKEMEERLQIERLEREKQTERHIKSKKNWNLSHEMSTRQQQIFMRLIQKLMRWTKKL
ncbi:hypothetical protein [Filifactor alocis]|uniref:hypothetical protein n=1 Tax=Filifactor alocis TaxID=143361 RepID=UPI003C6F6651